VVEVQKESLILVFLKAFEEYQIPIYCITGASAGALVGGLYVSGMSIKIGEISKSGELDDIFN